MWEATAEAGTFSFLGCLRLKRLEQTSYMEQKAVPGETVNMELPKHLLGSQLLFLCVFFAYLLVVGSHSAAWAGLESVNFLLQPASCCYKLGSPFPF